MEITQILVIEDQAGTASLIRMYLDDAGYRADLAYDAAEGLALFEQYDYQIIIIDYLLPDMNGLELLGKMQASTETTPGFIMLTAVEDVAIAVRAMKSGVDDYLIKDSQGDVFVLLPAIVNQVLEKKELEKQQKQMVQDLEAVNYAIAHDLKQPLSILNNTSYILRRYVEQGKMEHFNRHLDKLDRMTEQMHRTLDGLMLFAHTRYFDESDCVEVDLATSIERVINTLSSTIESCEAVLTVEEDLPQVYGHTVWVEEVLTNYLTNALKYGGKPPQIHICTKQVDNKIQVSVCDNGIGISPDNHDKLFMPFSRLREINAQGHGLGLSIAKHLIEKLGGTVGYSNLEDGGSEFYFTLRPVV